ncbi:MAG: ABC transporter ATP-binding protein, partial [Spirochaetales bacterium]|nr:ABC transporter ATP-binding protein [Spirochaetales bacterium]
LGPSGCGKTTLLRALAGLEHIVQGSIALDGRRIENLPPEDRSIGFVFQDLALFEQLSVRENIAYSLKIRRVPAQAAESVVQNLAERMRIRHLLDRLPAKLSGGERQRVAFARALASDPKLVLLDEPLSALDAPLRREMRRFLRLQLTSQGLTAVHVTHDAEEAAELADIIAIMRDGTMVRKGTYPEIVANPGSGWLAEFMDTGVVLPVEGIEGWSGIGFIRVRTPLGMLYASGDRVAATAAASMCLYCPHEGITIMPDNEAIVTGDAARNRIQGHLVQAVTSGNRTRALCTWQAAQPGSVIASGSFEVSLGESTYLKIGSTVDFRLDPARCLLLPGDPVPAISS